MPTLYTTQLPDGRGVIRFRGWIVGVFADIDRADRMRRSIVRAAEAVVDALEVSEEAGVVLGRHIEAEGI